MSSKDNKRDREVSVKVAVALGATALVGAGVIGAGSTKASADTVSSSNKTVSTADTTVTKSKQQVKAGLTAMPDQSSSSEVDQNQSAGNTATVNKAVTGATSDSQATGDANKAGSSDSSAVVANKQGSTAGDADSEQAGSASTVKPAVDQGNDATANSTEPNGQAVSSVNTGSDPNVVTKNSEADSATNGADVTSKQSLGANGSNTDNVVKNAQGSATATAGADSSTTGSDTASTDSSADSNTNSAGDQSSDQPNADSSSSDSGQADVDSNSADSSSTANTDTTTASSDQTAPDNNAKTEDVPQVTNNSSLNKALANNASSIDVGGVQVSRQLAIALYSSVPDSITIGQSGRPRVDDIDVASFQSWMTYNDFVTMKKLGVKTIIVKLTEGDSYVNPYAKQFIMWANQAGLNVDLYHFADFNGPQTATTEANHFLQELKDLGVNKSTLLIADVESTDNIQYGTWELGQAMSAFWGVLNSAGYGNHGVYTGANYAGLSTLADSVGGNSRVWVAQYPYTPSSSNLWNQSYGAWQFSSTDHIPGRSGSLDATIDYNGFLENSAGTNTLSQSASGFQTIGGQTYYYLNGIKQTGQKYINNHWYYFDDSTGAMKTGFVWIGYQNKEVYYNAQGQMQTGEQYLENAWNYFDPASGAQAKNKFVYLKNGNKTVYYDGNGHMLHGMAKVNGSTYYFDDNTGAMHTGIVDIPAGDNNGKAQTSYFDSNGKEVTGEVQVGNAWYYFDPNTGAMAKNALVHVDSNGGKTVLYGSDGKMQYGFQKAPDGKTYYFNRVNGSQVTASGFVTEYNGSQPNKVYVNMDNDTLASGYTKIGNDYYDFGTDGNHFMQTGLQTIDGKVHYFDPTTGKQVTGQVTVNGKKYYFDPTTGYAVTGFTTNESGKTIYYNSDGSLATHQQNIDGHWYYFNDAGEMQTGFVNIPSDQNKEGAKTVYYDKDGHMVYGYQVIDGKGYYFDPASGAEENNQFVHQGNNTYYYDGNGKTVTGFQTINGKQYYFNNSGVMQTGLQTINGKTYYFLTDGSMRKDQAEINGHYYNFDGTTGEMITGFKYIPYQNKTVYYDKNGWMHYGQDLINGYWYYFDPYSGAMKTGFVDIPADRDNGYAKTAYYDKDGHMQYGEIKVGNDWYYADPVSGAIARNKFVYLSKGNKTVYYQSNGVMRHGQLQIDGNYYYFDDVTGAMIKGFKYIPYQNKTVYYQDNGQMKYGQIKINGYWYYFAPYSGEMQTGLVTIPAQYDQGYRKTVLYDKNGHMLYGRQYVNGAWHYFNTTTGAMEY